MKCPSCGTENKEGRKFCAQCGSALALSCAVCGAANDPADRFCGSCGASLEGGAAAPVAEAPRSAAPSLAHAAERRVVSVLFADLVGFTALSEKRDAEETRELLSRYFDASRLLIGRYGGIVEKFIGDAVMAVWGTPVANEDDAERAVRAALELTDAVAALGDEIGAELHARVGVLTGEAAVTVGAEGQGMVAGDMVNTASRIQGEAAPGSVLVGERTRQASQAAIAYEDAGSHELKGKDEPVPLWRAVRVVAGRKGALKAEALEAPFVGRDREMRLVKELYHSSAEERTARLVSITGVAGVGKSRFTVEFEKYIDGLAGDVWWHRGRCLAYGEGVAYWALAEMVRGRAGIAEGEAPGFALEKLQATLQENVADPEERAWVGPRLAHLLGLEERTAGDQSDLFSAWRLFFERLADSSPVAMVFEDLQWADAALLDFIEYLLEWSKDHPLFVLTQSRPELADRRPTWGAGKRNFTSLSLEPLSAAAMEELMSGLVPGLPEELGARILERAEGIPLYAVETVRMLLDRGVLEKDGERFRAIERIEDLEVPETLHALIAARLDGLVPEERRLVQDAAVLGKTFTKSSVAALAGVDEPTLGPLLGSLVRKDVLSVQADPRSPERGQYGFLQDLMRKVAYDTLSKKERKVRHLAASDILTSSWGGEEDEIVEVVASHLVEAYRAAPDAPDAAEIKERAGRSLALAADRAASLAANEEAQGYFERAAELIDDHRTQAGLLERAGQMAWEGLRSDEAAERFRSAIELFEAEGATHPAARVSARLAEITWLQGHIDQAVEGMERSFAVLAADKPDEDLAWLAAQLGRLHYFMGHLDLATERLEQALQMAESLWLPEVLAQALNSKGALILDMANGRPEEGMALQRHSLHVALTNDVPSAALRAYYNLANSFYYRDRWPEALEYASAGLSLARKRGDRNWESGMLAMQGGACFLNGEWDLALETCAGIPIDTPATRFAASELLLILPQIHGARGGSGEAVRVLKSFASFEGSADVQEHACYFASEAYVLHEEGRHEEAIAAGWKGVAARDELGSNHASVQLALLVVGDAAYALRDTETLENLLAIVGGLGVGHATPLLRSMAEWFRARLNAVGDELAEVAERYGAAAVVLREAGMLFWLGMVLLEHAGWAAEHGSEGEVKPLLDEARDIFDRLAAKPWLERVDALASKPVVSSDSR